MKAEAASLTGGVFPVESIDRRYAHWEDHLATLTPWEQVTDGDAAWWAKREDRFAPLGYGGINGTKLRQLIWLAWQQSAASPWPEQRRHPAKGILTACSVHSPQAPMTAAVAAHYGMAATIIYGATDDRVADRHTNARIAANFGATFEHTTVAYNPVLQRALEESAARPDHAGWWVLPYAISVGDDDWGAVESFHAVSAPQTDNIPDTVRTLVFPFGSGNTAASILYGIARNRPPNLERVVLVGIGPNRLQWLDDRLAAIDHATGHHHAVAVTYRRRYHQHPTLEAAHQTRGPVLLEHYDLHGTFATYDRKMPARWGDIDLHPTYEGKVLTWLRRHPWEARWFWRSRGDVGFWIVGSEPHPTTRTTP